MVVQLVFYTYSPSGWIQRLWESERREELGKSVSGGSGAAALVNRLILNKTSVNAYIIIKVI